MKKVDDITVVTAFFDIGRGHYDYDNCEQRSVQKYMDYFEFWARIQNDLVIYTQKGLAEDLMKVRRKFGLEQKTKIVELDDVYSVEPEIFGRMKEIEKSESYLNSRFFKSEVSNAAKYDYVVFMKFWVMTDAVKRGLVGDAVAWVDFGFNHGGQCFLDAEEFDFLISGELSDKVMLYNLPKTSVQKTNAFDSLQFQFDTISSGFMVMPADKCEELYAVCKESVNSLLSLDCIDDDQQLLLMAVKAHPELFEVRESDWFMPVKEFWGGAHLTVSESWKNRTEPKEMNVFLRFLRKMKHRASGDKLASDSFLCRQKAKCRKYWKDR